MPLSALATNDKEENLSEGEVLSEIEGEEIAVETDNQSNIEGITTGEIITNEIEGGE
jgi:hypothetical protein